MRSVLTEIVKKIFDPAVGTEMFFTVITLGALVVAGMAIYATMLAIRALSRRR